MNDRLATYWFQPLTQLSIGVVSGIRAQNPLRASRPFGHTTYMVWIKGFEPLAPWSQAKCSTKLSYIQKIMVGMARLELARDSSQRSLSPLRLPIPPHPYARHARSVPDTLVPTNYVPRYSLYNLVHELICMVMDEGIAPSIDCFP